MDWVDIAEKLGVRLIASAQIENQTDQMCRQAELQLIVYDIPSVRSGTNGHQKQTPNSSPPSSNLG